ncbi:hypothetical protein PPL_02338 [Heterostelium album PN500]|uniref:Uncharacterized protein n=1 Tax=Heterostelium pallidum (strain ATCC 26659 / Pp 5 / PN500) TaxID=670386 RepID=D3B211_HETP5|nr:hypothetical protein PPL_02338 [Heterostelium album PN500]EFA85335.1 hypothetical protein PPL_02338 [Heterostelium album PN500]|eukprot:XP_020437444.1 hypothetical protein PPL_02338 [Heterostelium album PN500]
MKNVSQPQFYEFGANCWNYLKSRYTSAVIKADTQLFISKLKAPAEITVGDAKRVAGTVAGMTGLFFAGEVVGKNNFAGYWPGYDIDVTHDVLEKKH